MFVFVFAFVFTAEFCFLLLVFILPEGITVKCSIELADAFVDSRKPNLFNLANRLASDRMRPNVEAESKEEAGAEAEGSTAC